MMVAIMKTKKKRKRKSENDVEESVVVNEVTIPIRRFVLVRKGEEELYPAWILS